VRTVSYAAGLKPGQKATPKEPAAGNLILGPADPADPVRVIAASPNLFYGVRMLPWHIYGLGTAS
jgi:hypothetical protein